MALLRIANRAWDEHARARQLGGRTIVFWTALHAEAARRTSSVRSRGCRVAPLQPMNYWKLRGDDDEKIRLRRK